MKKIFMLGLSVIMASPGFSQVVVGNSGMSVGAGTVFSTQGLTLTPSSNLQLANDTIQVSSTPVNGQMGSSIAKVINISPAITFSGTVGLKYLASELNGNTESQLAIALNDGNSGNNFTTLTSFDSAAGTYYVYSPNLSNIAVGRVTAVNNNVVLPILVQDFSVRLGSNCSVIVSWKSDQTASDQVELQWSADGREWTTQAMDAKTTPDRRFYAIISNPASGLNFYRLAIRENQQPAVFTQALSQRVDCGNQDHLLVYPNPAHDFITLSTGNPKDVIAISIFDVSGREVLAFPRYTDGERISVKSLPVGSFLVRCTIGNRNVHTRLTKVQ